MEFLNCPETNTVYVRKSNQNAYRVHSCNLNFNQVNAGSYDLAKSILIECNIESPNNINEYNIDNLLEEFGYALSPSKEWVTIALKAGLLKDWRETNLNEIIDNGIDVPQLDDLVALLTKHCQEKTKRRVRSILRFPSTMNNWYIYKRLIFENGSWSYIAGQSYPDEIRNLRNTILN